MQIKEMIRWQTRSGETLTVGDVTVTPQSRARLILWPHGGWVRNAPRAILVERGGRAERIPGSSAEGEQDEDDSESELGQGFGEGGGGGGISTARPVAVISVGTDGVQIKPVVDTTKIALAALTAFGAMLMTFSRMWRRSRSRGGLGAIHGCPIPACLRVITTRAMATSAPSGQPTPE